jgi:hypothetical protein
MFVMFDSKRNMLRNFSYHIHLLVVTLGGAQ